MSDYSRIDASLTDPCLIDSCRIDPCLIDLFLSVAELPLIIEPDLSIIEPDVLELDWDSVWRIRNCTTGVDARGQMRGVQLASGVHKRRPCT